MTGKMAESAENKLGVQNAAIFLKSVWLQISGENRHFDPPLQNSSLLSWYAFMVFHTLAFITIKVCLSSEKKHQQNQSREALKIWLIWHGMSIAIRELTHYNSLKPRNIFLWEKTLLKPFKVLMCPKNTHPCTAVQLRENIKYWCL